MKYYLCTKDLYGITTGLLRFQKGCSYERVSKPYLVLRDELDLKRQKPKNESGEGFPVHKVKGWSECFIPTNLLTSNAWAKLKHTFL